MYDQTVILRAPISYLLSIRKLIAIQDEEEIDTYIEMLEQQSHDEDLEGIIILLKLGLYDKAMLYIQAFIHKSTNGYLTI